MEDEEKYRRMLDGREIHLVADILESLQLIFGKK